MATIYPTAANRHIGSDWEGWYGWKSTEFYPANAGFRTALRFDVGQVRVTGFSFSTNVQKSYDETVTYYAYLYDKDPQTTSVERNPIASASYVAPSGSQSEYIQHSFSFSGFSVDTSAYLYVVLSSSWDTGGFNNGSASVTSSQIPLTVAVSPSEVYPDAGQNSVTVDFGSSRLNRTITLKLMYNDQQIGSDITASSNTKTVDVSDGWLDTYAGGGNSMSVKINASDSAGRVNNSASFYVKRHGALRPSITSPSGKYDAGADIRFAWSASGDGSQEGYRAEYSRDGENWALLSRGGSETSFSRSGSTFQEGTTYWRVQVTNSYGKTSDWVQSSFSVEFNGPKVTLTAPTSGSRDGAAEIEFGWSIEAGSGSITGTQMEYSTDEGLSWTTLLDRAEAVTRYKTAIAQLPPGKITWHVRATDSIAGPGKWSNNASFTVTYAAVSQVIAVNSATSGVINAAADRQFKVALEASGPVYSPFTVSSASFFWRSGETGTFTELAMTPDGNTAAVTVPGGTFPSGRIEWYASATDNTDKTTETDRFVLTAMNAAVEAAPLSPVNTLESGSGPITFRWTYGSLNGSPQSRAQLQYSRNGSEWVNDNIFADVRGKETAYTAMAGTFPTGTIFWRVRSYNSAGTEGPWSAAVSFSNFSAPTILGVEGDGKPFLTVSWQVSEQEAFEIRVDGRNFGPYNGPQARSYTLPQPLADGLHSIGVRAQNRYGLWSEWADADTSVENTPGSAVTLSVNNESTENVWLNINGTAANIITRQPRDVQTTDPALAVMSFTFTKGFYSGYSYTVQELTENGSSWETVAFGGGELDAETVTSSYTIRDPAEHDGSLFRFSIGPFHTLSRAAKFAYAEPFQQSPQISGLFFPDAGYFLIYRDGKAIGKTFGNVFLDRAALNSHEYHALQVLPGGYYTRSNTVQASASVECPTIEALDGGEPLALRLSENADREARVTIEQEVIYTQYAGTEYPEAEIGEHRNKSIELDVAALMQNADFARNFEALIGKDVIVKTPAGEVVIGPLPGVQRRDPSAFKSWTFLIRQTNWRDFVDES